MIKEKNLASLRKTTYICRKNTLATKGQKMQKLAFATISADIQSIDVIEEQKYAEFVRRHFRKSGKEIDNEAISHVYHTFDGNTVDFTVEDMGTGIPAEDAEKIFEPFTKLNSYFDGAGCGLTVARSIARRLNGDVKLDTLCALGSRFIFTLPV